MLGALRVVALRVDTKGRLIVGEGQIVHADAREHAVDQRGDLTGVEPPRLLEHRVIPWHQHIPGGKHGVVDAVSVICDR